MIRRRRGAMMKKGQRKFKYSGIKYYKETASGVAINMAGGGANLNIKLAASFLDITNNVPDGATVGTRDSYKSLYSRYAIVGVKFKFVPTFNSTQSGGRAADRVVYAISRDPNGVINDELDILRQDDAKFTNTTKGFSIYVRNPEPILYSSAGVSNLPANAPPIIPGALNQVAASPSVRKWTWLPTRLDDVRQQHPQHVGADVFITSTNAGGDPYQAYTMFKTVYYAFKEQD